MIKEVHIRSRFYMDSVIDGMTMPFKKWDLISIYGDDKVYLTSNASKKIKKIGCCNALSLDFWDITDRDIKKIKKSHPKVTLFSEAHARKIIKFIDQCQSDDEGRALIVHCTAGISRSAAVGTFVIDYCQLSYQKFKKDNPSILPNQYVLKVLKDVADMAPSFSQKAICFYCGGRMKDFNGYDCLKCDGTGEL